MSPPPLTLPDGLIADTLNNRARRSERGHLGDDKIPRLHVSSLIKSGTSDFFCEREFVLRYMERRDLAGNSIPPKFALLFATGHFFGEFIVQEFLRRNPEFSQYAWGDWTCQCRQSREYRKTYAEVYDSKCKVCGTPLHHYLETDLFNPQKTVVGHADLILYVDGVFYVYEFKTIDRADIVFSEINDPLGDHLLQASNYYYMLKAEGFKVSSRLRFVYVDRSMSGIYTNEPFREVYASVVRADRLDAVYNKAKLCHSAIKKGVLPERRCESLSCSRAKQCTVAVSCFNRKLKEIQRMPLDLMRPSHPLASTASQSTTKNGTASSPKPARKTVRIRRESSGLQQKSSKG